jgi:ankyrin repeat protein
MGTHWYYSMDADGETPVSRAAKSGHLALMELMTRQREEDAPEVSAGDSLLQRAAYWGLDNAVRKLLDGGANPAERDRRGETALHKAARRGHLDAVEMLLGSGVDVNEANQYGMTALHWVALNGRCDVAECLLAAGADPNTRDGYTGGLTPLAVAKLMGYEELAALLGEHGGTW